MQSVQGRATSEQAAGGVSACRTGAHRVVEKERVRLKIGINIEIFHLLEIIILLQILTSLLDIKYFFLNTKDPILVLIRVQRLLLCIVSYFTK